MCASFTLILRSQTPEKVSYDIAGCAKPDCTLEDFSGKQKPYEYETWVHEHLWSPQWCLCAVYLSN